MTFVFPVVRVLPWMLGATLALAACGSDHAGYKDSDAGTGGMAGGGNGNAGQTGVPPTALDGTCGRSGAVQDCSEYFDVGGVTQCFVGVQLCVDGEWSICQDQEDVDALIEELGYDMPAAGGAGGSGS